MRRLGPLRRVLLATIGAVGAVALLGAAMPAGSEYRAGDKDWTPQAIAYSPDGKTMAAASKSGIVVYPATGGGAYGTIPIPGYFYPLSMLYTKSGRIYVAGGDGSLYLVDPPYQGLGGRIQAVEPGGANWLSDLALSPDGSRLAIGAGSPGSDDIDGALRLVDVATNKVVAAAPTDHDVMSIAYSPDGTKLFVAMYESPTIGIYDAKTLARVGSWNNPGNASDIAVDPAGRWLYARTIKGGSLVRYDISTGAMSVLSDEYNFWGDIVLNPSGTRLYTSTYDYVVELDAASGKLLHWRFWATPVDALVMSPQGERMQAIANDALWWGSVPFTENSSSRGVLPEKVRKARAYVSGGNVYVTWFKPRGVAPVDNYSVYETTFEGNTCDTRKLICRMTGLKKGKKYEFRVYAENERGAGSSVTTNSIVVPRYVSGGSSSSSSRPQTMPQKQPKPPQGVS